MYEKIWESHVVHESSKGDCLLYIDRHLVHEVSSPQAFQALRESNRKIHREGTHLAMPDHAAPTTKDRLVFIDDREARDQLQELIKNTSEFHIPYIELSDQRQGIVHIVGPEQGFTQPGNTLVCGDSHTSTHGAFGALAFGIGTSEIEHVLATQCHRMRRAKTLRITINGKLSLGVTAKDLALFIISKLGTAGGTGFIIEYAGDTVTNLSMEGRMTLCNLTIEAGARSGMVAPDPTTFDYLQSRPYSPSGSLWDQAVDYWGSLSTDSGAIFDKEVELNAADVAPIVTWGTSPEDSIPITSLIPSPNDFSDSDKSLATQRAIDYMGLDSSSSLQGLKIDHVFIGSCTNGRIEDMREAAAIAVGRQVAEGVRALVVPGSGLVKQQAEAEGIDKIFIESGFEWREPGCSMCVGLNPDRIGDGERCASTSNRNFEGRQGRGGRTHLLSPAMAAAAAITGSLTDVRSLKNSRE